jgi:hypothetical protein
MKQMSGEGEIKENVEPKHWLLLGSFGSRSNILKNVLNLRFLL